MEAYSNLGFQRVVVDWSASFVFAGSEQRDLLLKAILQDSDGLVTGTDLTFVSVLQGFELLKRTESLEIVQSLIKS